MKLNQYKLGASLSYINITLTNVVGLVLTPFIIKSLGDSEYGLYALIGSFISYLSLMDLGLNNTIVRFVSKYRAEKDKEGENSFLGDIFIIYGVISIVLLIIGIGIYFQLENIFDKSLEGEQVDRAKIMYLILLFNVSISLPGGAFTAICNSYEYFVFPRLVKVIRYIVRAILIVSILTLGGGAISLVMIDTILNVFLILTVMVFCFKKLNVKVTFLSNTALRMKPIFNYSLWIFIIAITQVFQWKAGQVVLGVNVNTVQVAVFAIGVMLGTYYGAFAGAINSLLLPKASKMIVEGKSSVELTNMMIKVGRVCVALSFLILSGFVIFGKEFISLWVGEVYNESWLVALLIMIGTTIPLTQSFGISILEARDKVKYKAISNLVTIVAGVIMGFILSRSYGLQGMIIPLASAMLLNSIITIVFFVKFFDFKLFRFFKYTFGKQLVCVVFLVVFVYKLKPLLNINSWRTLAVAILLYFILYCLVFYFGILNNEEKKLLKLKVW